MQHSNGAAEKFGWVEGMTSNVLGTRNAVYASIDCGVEHFVPISTNKGRVPEVQHGRQQAHRRGHRPASGGARVRGVNFTTMHLRSHGGQRVR